MNVEAISTALNAKGHHALASLLKTLIKDRPAERTVETSEQITAKRSTSNDFPISMLQEFNSRVETVDLTYVDEGSDETAKYHMMLGLLNFLTELSKQPNRCENCVRSIETLLASGSCSVPVDCLDHTLDLLEQQCLMKTLESFVREIVNSIAGLQLMQLAVESDNAILSKVSYERTLDRFLDYADAVPNLLSLMPFDLLARCIDEDELDVPCEDKVLKLIKDANIQDEKKLFELLSRIRYPFLSCDVYDELPTEFPQVLQCREYQLCNQFTNWLSQLPEKQLCRRRFDIISALEQLLIELHTTDSYDFVVVSLAAHKSFHEDTESLVVTCQHSDHDEVLHTIRLETDLKSTVEARSRCAIAGEKIVVGAECDNELWIWQIDMTPSGPSLPEEHRLQVGKCQLSFIDFAKDDKENYIFWRDVESDSYFFGSIQFNGNDRPTMKKTCAPDVMGFRFGFHKEFMIALCSTKFSLCDRSTRKVTETFDSPAGSLSQFLDFVVVPSDEGDRMFVFDFRVTAVEQGKKQYKNLLLVFNLATLKWDQESWFIDLDTTSVERRLEAKGHSGITLFRFQDFVGILADITTWTDKPSIHYRIIFASHGGDIEYTEEAMEINAITADGEAFREVLGLIPVDMVTCSKNTIFNRYCRLNKDSPDLNELRELAE